MLDNDNHLDGSMKLVITACQHAQDGVEKMMRRRVLAGIDIGGTKTAVVLSLGPPQILVRFVFPTASERGPNPAIRLIIEHLKLALLGQGYTNGDLLAIGVSCGSPLDSTLGLIQSPPNLSTWKDVPICRMLQTEFATPCFLENDANAGALAEACFGSGRGANNFIFLTMGTGLGAGLILNNQLYRGTSYAAGEIGHVRLSRTGPLGYGKVGSVEGWASGGGMAQLASMFVAKARIQGLHTLLSNVADQNAGVITAQNVSEAAETGDEVAMAVVKQVGERLGETMSILIDILNPECIAVGGLALRLGEDLLRPAREVVGKEAIHSSSARCRIVPAELGEQIGDVAALCVAERGLIR